MRSCRGVEAWKQAAIMRQKLRAHILNHKHKKKANYNEAQLQVLKAHLQGCTCSSKTTPPKIIKSSTT